MRVTALVFIAALIGFGAVAFGLSTSARADVVELKNGQRVEGNLREATATTVVVEVGGQPITFPADKVRAIYYGTAPQAATAPSTSQPGQPSALPEALRALKGLRSVTRGGISLGDYATRVSDARIKVDQFLAEADVPQSRVGAHIKMAMDYHSIAANSWPTMSQVFRKPVMFVSRADTSLLLKCPDFKPYLDELTVRAQVRAPRAGERPADVSIYGVRSPDTVLDGPSIIWTCASGEIAEAEKLVFSPASAPGQETSQEAGCPPGLALNRAQNTCVRQ